MEKPVYTKTWFWFVLLVIVDVLSTIGAIFIGLYDFFWYQLLWMPLIFEQLNINTSGPGEFGNPSAAGLIAFGLSILIILLVIFLISRELSKWLGRKHEIKR